MTGDCVEYVMENMQLLLGPISGALEKIKIKQVDATHPSAAACTTCSLCVSK